MVDTPMMALGGTAMGIVYNVLKGAGVGALALGLYYGIKFFQKTFKKQKAFITKAVIVDLNGVIDFDDMAFVKNDESGMLEMEFRIRKQDTLPPIPKHLIKNGLVMLLNYAPGHYCVINTFETIMNLSKGVNTIVPFNLGMKKYIIARQREILNKIEGKKKNWELYAPWITLGLSILAACVLAFFLFYFGLKIDTSNIANRFEECKSLIGGA
jgi:hypothetical protein